MISSYHIILTNIVAASFATLFVTGKKKEENKSEAFNLK